MTRYMYNGILLSHKKNEIMLFVATWMNLEIIILSEVREGKIPYDIIYMWKLKYGNNELIYKTEQVHRHRKHTYGYQTGKRVKEG